VFSGVVSRWAASSVLVFCLHVAFLLFGQLQFQLRPESCSTIIFLRLLSRSGCRAWMGLWNSHSSSYHSLVGCSRVIWSHFRKSSQVWSIYVHERRVSDIITPQFKTFKLPVFFVSSSKLHSHYSSTAIGKTQIAQHWIYLRNNGASTPTNPLNVTKCTLSSHIELNRARPVRAASGLSGVLNPYPESKLQFHLHALVYVFTCVCVCVCVCVLCEYVSLQPGMPSQMLTIRMYKAGRMHACLRNKHCSINWNKPLMNL